MPLLIGILLTSFMAFSADVATIDPNPNNRNEILLIITEDSLQTTLDKSLSGHPCRPRIGNNNLVAVRENGFPYACRAEITKFLLNNGYKSVDFRTFSK